MILGQITIPKLPLKFLPIKTSKYHPHILTSVILRHPFKMVKISHKMVAPLEETHPLKG